MNIELIKAILQIVSTFILLVIIILAIMIFLRNNALKSKAKVRAKVKAKVFKRTSDDCFSSKPCQELKPPPTEPKPDIIPPSQIAKIPITIELMPGGSAFMARKEGGRCQFACGHSIAEAVGRLVMAEPILFNCKLLDLSKKETPQCPKPKRTPPSGS